MLDTFALKVICIGGLVFFTFIASMMFLPVMLLIPLIGGGRFKTESQQLRGSVSE